MAEHLFATLRDEGAQCDAVRCVDFDIAPGAEADMGGNDLSLCRHNSGLGFQLGEFCESSPCHFPRERVPQ
jgi:hypothetical protein